MKCNHRYRLKSAVCLYLVSWSTFVYLSVVPNTTPPVSANYVVLFVLFLIPAVTVLKLNVPKWLLSLFLLSTTSVTMLATIGPNQAGLYGYDPYTYSLEAYRLFQSGSMEIIAARGHWIAFPALVSIAVETLDLSVIRLGKYLPIVVSTVPVFLFLGLSNVIDDSSAFLVALGVASTRTLLLFEVKFIEEPFALILLFSSILAIFTVANRNRQSILVFLLVFTLGLMHHYIAAVCVLILIVWALIPILPLPARFNPMRTNFSPAITHGFVAAILLIIVFMYIYGPFTRFFILNFVVDIGPSTPSITEPSTVTGLRTYLSLSSLAVYFILASITAGGVLSRKNISDWELSWAVLSGLFAIAYLGAILGGEKVPLSGSRFLVILIPFLLSISIVFVTEKKFSVPKAKTVAVVLVVGLVITQLAAIEPYRINTNPSQMVYPEAHYTSSEYATADWMIEYGGGQQIVDEQPHLWAARGYSNQSTLAASSVCRGYSVEREEYLGIDQWSRPPDQSVIYSGGGITIGNCG